MLTQNLYEIMYPNEIPTMNFMIKKEFNDFKNLKKSILLKEILFKNNIRNQEYFTFYTIHLQDELGELYTEFNHIIKKLGIIKNE